MCRMKLDLVDSKIKVGDNCITLAEMQTISMEPAGPTRPQLFGQLDIMLELCIWNNLHFQVKYSFGP